MMKELIWFASIALVVLGHSTQHKSKLNIEQFGNVARFFNTATLCEHKSDVKVKHDDEGRLIISFKTNLKPNESDGKKILFKFAKTKIHKILNRR